MSSDESLGHVVIRDSDLEGSDVKGIIRYFLFDLCSSFRDELNIFCGRPPWHAHVLPIGEVVKHNALTQMTAKSLPPGKHADGQGLWLVKREKAHGKWVLRLPVYGNRREMGLGRWPNVSLKEARKRAEDARRALRGGVDPIYERLSVKRTGKPLTVNETIDGCFEAREADLKGDGVAGRWMSPLLVHVIPKIGNYPVTDIDQHVLKALLDPLRHKIPDAAEKALNRIGLTLKYAAASGLNVDLQATMKARALRLATNIAKLADVLKR